MLKKTIEYVDYNGVKHTEDYYFNLTKAEIIELQMGTKGGFVEAIQEAIKNEDSQTVMKATKDLIMKAYGKKSEDGKRFIKSPELALAFEQSPAYSELYVELLTDDEASSKFMRGVIPADLAASIPENA